MSSNSGVIVNRSNDTSPFFQALQSRNSKSLPELYSAEVNTESAAQSVVEVESSSAAGMSRTVRIELPRYGLLNRLYLHTRFAAAVGTASAANYISQIPWLGAMIIKEARLSYNGATLQKTDGFQIVADIMKNGTAHELRHLQELLGGYDANSGSLGAHAASKFGNATGTGVGTSARSIAGGSGANDGKQDFYCPLDFYFSAKHSPNRALDLSVLSSPVILEIDIEASSNVFKGQGTGVAAPLITNVSAMCYMTELDLEVEKNYRALSYQAGGSPLTQIGFNTERVVVASSISVANPDKVVDVQLNQFTGNIYKLIVYAVKSDNFGSNLTRIRPGIIQEIQLKATGTNIVNQDNLQNKEAILESYHTGGNFYPLAGNTPYVNINMSPGNFYELNFKKPYDMSKVSNSGSVALGQLSVPTLRVVLQGHTNTGQFGSAPTPLGSTYDADIHVIAYSTSLMSYNTNASGSTSIRMISN